MYKTRFLVLFCGLLLTTIHIESKTAKKNNARWPGADGNDVESWTGGWFPHAPPEEPVSSSTLKSNSYNSYAENKIRIAANSSDFNSSADPPFKHSKTGTNKKASALRYSKENEVQSWTGGWFPIAPNNHATQNLAHNNAQPPSEQKPVTKKKDSVQHYHDNEANNVDSWSGGWFPFPPHERPTAMKANHTSPAQSCDDGKVPCNLLLANFWIKFKFLHNFLCYIAIDFDPSDKRHSYNYLCLANRTRYVPDLQCEPVLVEHFVPPAYEPPVKCQNESIGYNAMPPTYGPFRMLAPQYGSYVYLPPQRWLHSLADGAIVLLYHPCANPLQVTLLQNILRGCLYRHIITPSQMLTAERPLALMAWGKCLQMSVVDDHIVVDFIKHNAKKGSKSKPYHSVKQSQLYVAGLLSEAHLVTDINDTEICGFKEM